MDRGTSPTAHSPSAPPLAGEECARSAQEGASPKAQQLGLPPLQLSSRSRIDPTSANIKCRNRASPISDASGGEGPHAHAATPTALILGGAHGSLAIARSLGRRGIDVALLTDHHLAGFSRFVQRKFTWDGPNSSD